MRSKLTEYMMFYLFIKESDLSLKENSPHFFMQTQMNSSVFVVWFVAAVLASSGSGTFFKRP